MNVPITTHLVYLPPEYPWATALSDHGERYLEARGLDSHTFFWFRDCGEGEVPFTVTTYAMPDRPNDLIPPTGIPANWQQVSGKDGFAEFVVSFARAHQEMD